MTITNYKLQNYFEQRQQRLYKLDYIKITSKRYLVIWFDLIDTLSFMEDNIYIYRYKAHTN